MENLEERIKSFKEPKDGLMWPHLETSLTPERMAAAGLYFAPTRGYGDMVRCYSCGTRLCGFLPTDDPVLDHKTHSPTCQLSMVDPVADSSNQVSTADPLADLSHPMPQLSSFGTSKALLQVLSKQKVIKLIQILLIFMHDYAETYEYLGRRIQPWFMCPGQSLARASKPNWWNSVAVLGTRLSSV
jgi:hypothetical protein